jgi:transcriptional regulator with XRE-family HTH domain
MVDTQETLVLIRTAVVLTKFLDDAKAKGSSHERIVNNPDYLINSFGKIALEAGIRKHTVADILNGKRSARIPTLAIILEALNKTMADFGKSYDRVTDSDIQKFKERSNLKKTAAPAKKKIKK